MIHAAAGLTAVSTQDLKRALAFVHRGELRCPLTIGDLTRVGLQHCANSILDLLRDVDERGVRAALVAAIAERLPQNEERRRFAEASGESSSEA